MPIRIHSTTSKEEFYKTIFRGFKNQNEWDIFCVWCYFVVRSISIWLFAKSEFRAKIIFESNNNGAISWTFLAGKNNPHRWQHDINKINHTYIHVYYSLAFHRFKQYLQHFELERRIKFDSFTTTHTLQYIVEWVHDIIYIYIYIYHRTVNFIYVKAYTPYKKFILVNI